MSLSNNAAKSIRLLLWPVVLIGAVNNGNTNLHVEDSDKDYQELYEDELLHDDEGDDYWSKYTGESSKQKQFMVFSFDETTLSKI